MKMVNSLIIKMLSFKIKLNIFFKIYLYNPFLNNFFQPSFKDLLSLPFKNMIRKIHE